VVYNWGFFLWLLDGLEDYWMVAVGVLIVGRVCLEMVIFFRDDVGRMECGEIDVY
jgi:hypothetical protein